MIDSFKTIDTFGTIRWYKNGGILHRVDGPAVEYPDDYREWYLCGKLHRVGGPAIESTYRKVYYINGKCHRLDGPALINSKYGDEWYYNDKLIKVKSQEEFEQHLRLKAFW